MAFSQYDIRFILSVTDRTGNSMRRVASDMRTATADANRMKKAFTALDVGRGLQLRGLLGGAALGAAAQQAANFSTLVTKAATQAKGATNLNQIGQNTIKLEKEILDLMGQFPASAQEQADAAYDIFSAMNVPLQQGVGFLKLFNMVAVAGATDLETATNAMITILNNYGGTWQSTMKAVNTSFAIIRYGRLEFSEFNDMLNAVVPSAKAAGQSLEDVSGAMAFITTRIPSQRQGATAIARLLEVFARTDFRAGAKKMGLEIENIRGELKPLPEIVAELARLDISKAQSTINSLFQVVTATGRGGGRGIQSTIQARKALILLVKEYRQYLGIQKEVTGATTEFEKRYTMMIGSAGVKWEKFKAQLQALLIMVGAAAIPMFERLGEILGKGIDWARNNRGMIEFIVKATLAASVASLLAGTILKLYGAGLILYTGIRRIGMVTAPLAAGWVRVTGVIDKAAAVMFRMAPGILMLTGFSSKLTHALPFLARNMLLAAASIAAVKTAGIKGVAGLLPLMAILGRLARIGVITVGVNVIMNLIKKDKRDRSAFLAKRGLLGSAALNMIFGSDFGTSKWFATKETKAAIEEFDRKQKAARDPGFKKVAKGFDTSVKGLLAQIRRDLKSTGGDLFNAKMLKDLGFDPNELNKQINDMINQPPGGVNKQEMANSIVQGTKDLLSQATDKLVSVYQQFRDENQQAFGELFQGPLMKEEGDEAQLRKAWNWKGVTGNLLADMKAQLSQFRNWRKGLDTLLKKGFSKDFVAEIKKMGPEGMKHIDELKKAGPKRVKEFNRVFAAGKAEVEKATEIDFNKQLAKWNSFGKDTAFKILTGMESEEQNLQTRMTAMVSRLYTGVATAIATEAAKLQFVMPEMPDPTQWNLGPKLPEEPKDVWKPGMYKGRYAIPAATAFGGVATPFGSLPQVTVGQVQNFGKPAAIMPQITAPQVTNIFQVDGTFLTPEEMMNAAMRQAALKTKNKR